MGKQFYLNLYILCAILSQGIAALADETTNNHVRTKRLIDRTRNGNQPVPIESVRFIVSVLENELHVCSGIILLLNVILTTAVCVIHLEETLMYSVKSGSAIRHGGMNHVVLKIRHHPEFVNEPLNGDIALVTIYPNVNPAINHPIPLYNGRVPPNTFVTTSGWGYINLTPHGERRDHPNELRSITVPTIGLNQCRHELRAYNHTEFVQKLSDKVICTYDRFVEKHASVFDDGNPLVFHDRKGAHLIGVMFWTQYNGYPDVYVNLAYPPYKAWITRKLGQITTSPP